MTTDYLIFCFADDPVYDALPVMKVTHYPDEPADYKPFAQGILCMQGSRMHMRLWAFEARPEPMSTLALALEGPNGVRFTLSADLSGHYEARIDDGPCVPLPDIRPIAGEDLQGEYWGVDVTLSEEATAALGVGDHKKGTRLRGNLYKLCAGKRPHFGSFASTESRDLTACPAHYELADF